MVRKKNYLETESFSLVGEAEKKVIFLVSR